MDDYWYLGRTARPGFGRGEVKVRDIYGRQPVLYNEVFLGAIGVMITQEFAARHHYKIAACRLRLSSSWSAGRSYGRRPVILRGEWLDGPRV